MSTKLPLDVHCANIVENDHLVICSKWCFLSQHLKDEDTNCPPIHCVGVTMLIHNLGSQVFGGTTDSVGFALQQFLCETVVSDLEVTGLINEQVLGFQVTVHVSMAVHVVNGQDDTRGIELSLRLIQRVVTRLQVQEQLTTHHLLHHHEQIDLILECGNEADCEGGGEGLHHRLLTPDVVDHVFLHNLLLGHNLQCIQSTSVLN
mmetsp:Transcript_38492/g.46475  ORF Transcript_38492/g.46475 Transcript_38492/m.46475 type:complete len:204 (-) Transcript_38492:2022-2633(-)